MSPAWIGGRAMCALLVAAVASRAAAADESPPWEIAPYRVRLSIAVEARRAPQAELQSAIARTIKQRVDAALRPLWALDLQLATTFSDRATCFAPKERAWGDFSADERTYDKLLWLGVEDTPAGFALSCREFDAYTRRWGPTLQRQAAQRSSLGEACFQLAVDAFTPLAHIDTTGDDGNVRLRMRGGQLPRPPGSDLLVAPGDAFLPLVRRTGRGGELAENGIVPVPWTYLTTAETESSGWLAHVQSALKNPLAARRRGSVEQVAVALPTDREPIKVRFFARSNREQGLAGYEVFRLSQENAAPQLVGLTDRHGLFTLPPDKERVTTLLLRSDGQVLAKLVVASGTAAVLEAPIADDMTRLVAQGEVQAVREELVDVVARRALLIARIETLLKKGDAAEARKLMDDLNELPTPSVFANRMGQVHERLPKSDDPRVRQTVDSLFSATRELLSKFLDARVITNLQAKVNEAARAGS